MRNKTEYGKLRSVPGTRGLLHVDPNQMGQMFKAFLCELDALRALTRASFPSTNRTLRVAARVLNTINTNKRIWIFSAEIFTIQVAS